MSKIKVNEIEKASGSGITIPTGTSFTVTDGISSSSLPTIPVTKGGTGLTSIGSAGNVLKVNSGGSALEFGSAGGIVASGTFANGRNFGHYNWSDQTSTSSTSEVDVNGSAWNFGAGALTANKTCIFNYSIATFTQDWCHGALIFQYSTDDGANWSYVSSSEDRHQIDHENSSGTNSMSKITGSYNIDFTSGQTPRFRFKTLMYSGSNAVKINYDHGNDGTVKSYYHCWWV